MGVSRVLSMCILLVLSFCLLFSTSIGSRPECQQNNLQPDNEIISTELNDFLMNLEIYTGMNGDKPNVVDVSCPDENKRCTVNANGTAIWDARMKFYQKYMMAAIDGSDVETETLKNTLDGCLCYSKDVEDYNSCMKTLRQTMNDHLDTISTEFASLVGANSCALYSENCI